MIIVCITSELAGTMAEAASETEAGFETPVQLSSGELATAIYPKGAWVKQEDMLIKSRMTFLDQLKEVDPYE
jgi:hypothetical protein